MKKTFVGGKCDPNNQDKDLIEKTLNFREDIMKHWGINGWKKNTDIIISNEQTNEITEEHPVIWNLLKQDKKYKLEKDNEIWCFYDGYYHFGLADYKFIFKQINNVINLEDYKENTISKLIKKIFEDYGKKLNYLQPRLLEIFVLQYFIDQDNYKKMNELQSQNYSNEERWKSYLELFYSKNKLDNKFINFDLLGSGHEEDLDERALIITDRCINNTNIKSIHTMDGHGRFITRLIKKLVDEKIFEKRPEFNIFVYDLDDETDLWHKITMPLGTAKKMDILAEINQAIDDESIDEKLFYVNFSGLTIKVKEKQYGGVKSRKSVKSKRKTVNKTYKQNSLKNSTTLTKTKNTKTSKKTVKIIKPTYTSLNQGDNIINLYERLLEKDRVSHLIVSFANVRDTRHSKKLYDDILLFNKELMDDKNRLEPLTKRSMKDNKLGQFITVGTI